LTAFRNTRAPVGREKQARFAISTVAHRLLLATQEQRAIALHASKSSRYSERGSGMIFRIAASAAIALLSVSPALADARGDA
jgi:hypothetical protein